MLAAVLNIASTWCKKKKNDFLITSYEKESLEQKFINIEPLDVYSYICQILMSVGGKKVSGSDILL